MGVGDWWDAGQDGVQEGIVLYQSRFSGASSDLEKQFGELSMIAQSREPLRLTMGEVAVVVEFKNSAGRRKRARERLRATLGILANGHRLPIDSPKNGI